MYVIEIHDIAISSRQAQFEDELNDMGVIYEEHWHPEGPYILGYYFNKGIPGPRALARTAVPAVVVQGPHHVTAAWRWRH